jgi:hypothetical protein
MNLDEQDERDDLWDLLGKARQPAVSPFFSRNVLRATRELPQDAGGAWALAAARACRWLRRHWRASVVSTCAASLALGGVLGERFQEQSRLEHQEINAMAERVTTSPDLAVIGDLDALLDSEKNSVWLDNNAD